MEAAPSRRRTNHTTLTGTASANVPLAGYQITSFDAATEKAELSFPPSGADGRYSTIIFGEPRPPFLIAATDDFRRGEPQYPQLYSIALRGGTTNTTPLTSLLVARLLNRKPSFQADLRAARELQGVTLRAAQQQGGRLPAREAERAGRQCHESGRCFGRD